MTKIFTDKDINRPTPARASSGNNRSIGRYASLKQAHDEVVKGASERLDNETSLISTDLDNLAEAAKEVETVQQKNLEGFAQVPVVLNVPSNTPEPLNILFNSLAGTSPHAPLSPLPASQRKDPKKRKGSKEAFLGLRMPTELKAQLEAKAADAESYPSAHVLELIARDVGLPVDTFRAAHNKLLKRAFADLRIAFDDCGVNLNQMSKATNAGKPCPLTRQEIDEALKGFKRGCLTLETLRPS